MKWRNSNGAIVGTGRCGGGEDNIKKVSLIAILSNNALPMTIYFSCHYWDAKF